MRRRRQTLNGSNLALPTVLIHKIGAKKGDEKEKRWWGNCADITSFSVTDIGSFWVHEQVTQYPEVKRKHEEVIVGFLDAAHATDLKT